MRTWVGLAGLAITGMLAAPAAATVVSVPNRTDQIYDDSRGLLYLSTSTGLIQRYNPATNTLLSSWTVGANISAIDITPDNQYLLATDNAVPSVGVIHRVNLSTGEVTNFVYDNPEGRGSFDIVALNDGRAIFTANHMFSGDGVLVRSIDYATWTVAPFLVDGNQQFVQKNQQLWRNSARNMVAFVDTNLSTGDMSIFSTATEHYTTHVSFGSFLSNMRISITPDSASIAMAGTNVGSGVRSTSTLSVTGFIANANGGLAYDPTGTLLYDGNQTANAIQILRTSDYNVVGSIAPAGASLTLANVPGNGMTVSGDGKWLFLYSSNGLNVYSVTPAAVPEPTSLAIAGVGIAGLLLRRRHRVA